MNCTSMNLIYVITCAGCGHNYVGETDDVLRNRVTLHKQQIRDPHTHMLGKNKERFFILKYKPVLNYLKLR